MSDFVEIIVHLSPKAFAKLAELCYLLEIAPADAIEYSLRFTVKNLNEV